MAEQEVPPVVEESEESEESEEMDEEIIIEDHQIRRIRKIGRFTVEDIIPLRPLPLPQQPIPQQPVQQQPIPNREQVSDEDWEKMFKKVKFKKEEMDSLVMDYLISHELADVAETFHRESGCEPGIDLEQLRSQKIIRELISSHQIDEAINLINEKFGSSFLGDRPRTHFCLEQQKMIELCRSRNFEAALTFSRQFIRWESFKSEKDDFKKECRRTLLLMVFGDDPDYPAAELMDTTRLLNIGLVVVEEIIISQGRGLYSGLPYSVGNTSIVFPGGHMRCSFIERALKMLRSTESKLREEVNFPHFDLNTGYPGPFPPPAGQH